MNITKYIQENILGDSSAVVTRKLDEHLEVVSRDVYDYHNWRWLKRSEELTLTTNIIEYELSGNGNDLSKMISMFYGDDMRRLNDDCQDEEAFYKLKYGQMEGETPNLWVAKEKINEYTWKFIIYPCSAITLETVTYYYKKTFNIADIPLYPNPMVFIDGIMEKFLTGVAVNTKDPVQASKMIQLARDYKASYLAGRELMKQNDSAVTKPKTKIDVSDEQKAFQYRVKRLQRMGRI